MLLLSYFGRWDFYYPEITSPHGVSALDIITDIAPIVQPFEKLSIPVQTARARLIADYVVLLIFTVLVTGLVSVRRVQVRRLHIRTMGKHRR